MAETAILMEVKISPAFKAMINRTKRAVTILKKDGLIGREDIYRIGERLEAKGKGMLTVKQADKLNGGSK